MKLVKSMKLVDKFLKYIFNQIFSEDKNLLTPCLYPKLKKNM